MQFKDTFFSRKLTLNYNGEILNLSSTQIIGILNITPDSFYNGGKYNSIDKALQRTEQIIAEGGAIIDIGAYSSRPGAKNISEAEELTRLIPILKNIRQNFPDSILSVDTFRSDIAKKMVMEHGVNMINDISGGNFDDNMFKTIAELNVPYILMHMKGTPQDMQINPTYKNLIKEIFIFFSDRVEKLKSLGVNDVILDPGFGFGKTLDHNYELLKKLDFLKIFQLPISVGISRKSMIYKLLNSSASESLNGTTVLNTVALLSGVNLLRVHDVKEAVETIKLVTKLEKF